MNVTDVRITLPAKTENRLLAYASVTFDDCFVVHGLKVIDGERNLFVAMPSKPNKNSHGKEDKFLDIVHPISHACRQAIDTAVLDAYCAATAGEKIRC
jgi:stage V sporulation protein G